MACHDEFGVTSCDQFVDINISLMVPLGKHQFQNDVMYVIIIILPPCHDESGVTSAISLLTLPLMNISLMVPLGKHH